VACRLRLQVYVAGLMRHSVGVSTVTVMDDDKRLPRLGRRIVRLADHRLFWLDLLVAVVFADSAIHVAASTSHLHEAGTGWEVVRNSAIVVASAALPLRRRHPRAALGIVLPAVAVALALQVEQPFVILSALALYSVTVSCPRRTSRQALGLVAGVTTAAVVIGGGSSLGLILVADLAVVAVAWLLGENARGRRASVAVLAERTAEREAARDERARRAVADERLAIARELHDIVAHAMSVIAVRSGVARVVMDSRPEEAREALGAIETTSRQALQEMRLLVGVLRRGEGDGDSDSQRSPAPGLSGLPELVAQARAAGVDVSVDIEGDRRPLPEGAELSAYRIIQEALTNVVRHVGPTRARVRLVYLVDQIVIEVIDEGGRRWDPPHPDPAGGGNGLVGMRERVALYGGELVARPHGHGFEVRATLRTVGVSR
jgi:signal transduction histidine kinase